MRVLKFGGAALKDFTHIKKVAKIIALKKKEGSGLIVVVSAMGSTTDSLIAMAGEVSLNPPKRELDMLLSVGERISMALLVMALFEEGVEAISFTGSQAGIITSEEHTDGRIVDVKPRRISPYIEEGKVVVVAGFQGVSLLGEITTLGRGGSDTTAVALGVAFRAECIEFYKDVEGIFESDPKLSKEARHLPRLTYQEALKIIQQGKKKVLHPRAVILAAKNYIPLYVRSFQENLKETAILEEGKSLLEEVVYEELQGASI